MNISARPASRAQVNLRKMALSQSRLFETVRPDAPRLPMKSTRFALRPDTTFRCLRTRAGRLPSITSSYHCSSASNRPGHRRARWHCDASRSMRSHHQQPYELHCFSVPVAWLKLSMRSLRSCTRRDCSSINWRIRAAAAFNREHAEPSVVKALQRAADDGRGQSGFSQRRSCSVANRLVFGSATPSWNRSSVVPSTLNAPQVGQQ
jgi:hypothetical protein